MVDIDSEVGESGVFYMEITIVGAFLEYIKIVNLDFRRQKYRFKDDRSDQISTALTIVMILINIYFIVRTGMDSKNIYDDSYDDTWDDADDQPKLNRRTHRKMHGLLEFTSNAAVSAITILFHFIFKEGKFNKKFLMGVARSYLIFVGQLPIQIVTLAKNSSEDWSTSLLVFQIVVECTVLYVYHRVWAKVRDDQREYKSIKKVYYMESFLNPTLNVDTEPCL